MTTHRSADGGIDGRLYFAMPQESATKRDPLRSMVLEVKGGASMGIAVVRDLRGVLEREEAEMAGLIVMEPLGLTKERNFRREMAQAGDLDVFRTKYGRMQLLTVEDILAGKALPHAERGGPKRWPGDDGAPGARLMYALVAVTVCAVLAQSAVGQAREMRALRHTPLVARHNGRMLSSGVQGREERLRQLATDTGYIVTRAKVHCRERAPRFDFGDRERREK